MNKFLKFFLFVSVTVSVVFAFSSCNNDDDGYWRYYTSRGTIQGTADAFDIMTDGGVMLNVVRNNVSGFEIEDGQRVLVSYVIEAQSQDRYDVEVIAMTKLLTKEPVYLSKLTPEEKEDIGNDPIGVYDAWFGGKKYLNIDFEIRVSNPNIAHFINLVVDEENSTDDEVIVTLTQNAFGDYPSYPALGRVSFDMTGLVPEGKKEVKITLKWTDYSGITKSDSGVFKLDEGSTIPSARTESNYSETGTAQVR